jgi:CRP-like cAMP-binding protein
MPGTIPVGLLLAVWYLPKILLPFSLLAWEPQVLRIVPAKAAARSIMLQSASKNELLRRLSTKDFELLSPHLERVELELRTVVHPAGRPMEFAYFPDTCIVSSVAKVPKGKDVEVGMIGFEGMTGNALLLGDDRQPLECVIQYAGVASRVASSALAKAVAASPSLKAIFLRYVHGLSIQASYTAWTNARSTLEQRLARWLLMYADRIEGETLAVTHEYLSILLGVRRPGVTVGIQILEGKGLIRAKRGLVVIRDREGLIELAEGAYGIPEAEHKRLVG